MHFSVIYLEDNLPSRRKLVVCIHLYLKAKRSFKPRTYNIYLRDIVMGKGFHKKEKNGNVYQSSLQVGVSIQESYDPFVCVSQYRLLPFCLQQHSSECCQIPADCPNGCGEVIPREEVCVT